MLSIPSKKIWVIIFPIDAPTKTNRLVEHKLTFESLHLKWLSKLLYASYIKYNQKTTFIHSKKYKLMRHSKVSTIWRENSKMSLFTKESILKCRNSRHTSKAFCILCLCKGYNSAILLQKLRGDEKRRKDVIFFEIVTNILPSIIICNPPDVNWSQNSFVTLTISMKCFWKVHSEEKKAKWPTQSKIFLHHFFSMPWTFVYAIFQVQ